MIGIVIFHSRTSPPHLKNARLIMKVDFNLQLFGFLTFLGSCTSDNVSEINVYNFFYDGLLRIALQPFFKSMKSIFLGQLTFGTSFSRRSQKHMRKVKGLTF